MCDASEHAAGYVLPTKDYTDAETGETVNFAPVAFRSGKFTTGQPYLTMHYEEFLAKRLAFGELRIIFRGTKKRVIVVADNITKR